MIRTAHRLPLPLLLVIASAAGCAADPAADADDVDQAASEVRTRQCPATFTLRFSDVVPETIPREVVAGAGTFVLEPEHRARFEKVQANFVRVGRFEVTATLAATASGVCRYRQSDDEFGATIKFFTKGGKDILEIGAGQALFGSNPPTTSPSAHAHRVYAFPASYSPEGFTFDAGSRALLDGVISPDGGPGLVVKVGNAAVH